MRRERILIGVHVCSPSSRKPAFLIRTVAHDRALSLVHQGGQSEFPDLRCGLAPDDWSVSHLVLEAEKGGRYIQHVDRDPKSRCSRFTRLG